MGEILCCWTRNFDSRYPREGSAFVVSQREDDEGDSNGKKKTPKEESRGSTLPRIPVSFGGGEKSKRSHRRMYLLMGLGRTAGD